MAGFNSRRGHALYPNIANLNAIPSDPSDYNLVMQRHQDGYELEQELALFTNTQFFDFDSNMSPEGFDGAPSQNNDTSFNLLTDDFQIPDLGLNLPSNSNMPQQQQQQQQQQRQRQQSSVHQYQRGYPQTQTSSPSSSSVDHTSAADKRKLDTMLEGTVSPPNGSTNLDDPSRYAAEEDKRRRNTAASARFRAKKKQREEAMEKTAKEMTDKVTSLEMRLAKLEMENKLLKELITEKSGKDVDVNELIRRVSKAKESGSKADKAAAISAVAEEVAVAQPVAAR